jgi:hypothetical protein
MAIATRAGSGESAAQENDFRGVRDVGNSKR